jgi:hypothetical protein
MKTIPEFIQFFSNQFFNELLVDDLEKYLLQTFTDDGKFRAYYGKDNFIDKDYLIKPFFIDVGTKTYRYESESIRNVDLETLKLMINKFREVNGLSVKDPVYVN